MTAKDDSKPEQGDQKEPPKRGKAGVDDPTLKEPFDRGTKESDEQPGDSRGS